MLVRIVGVYLHEVAAQMSVSNRTARKRQRSIGS